MARPKWASLRYARGGWRPARDIPDLVWISLERDVAGRIGVCGAVSRGRNLARMPESDQRKGYPGFAFLLFPLAWCDSQPSPPTHDNMQESVYATTLSVGLAASVTREGLVVIDFAGWPETAKLAAAGRLETDALLAIDERRIATANAYLACLHTAMGPLPHTKQVITPADVVHVQSLDLAGAAFYSGNPLTTVFSTVWSPTPPEKLAVAGRVETERLLTLPRDTIASSFVLLEHLLATTGVEGARIAALYLRAVKAAEDEEYGLALIVAWSLAERMLNARWIEYLKAQGLSNTRIDALDSRSWTTSVVTEALSIAGKITDGQRTELNVVRNLRNKWAHELRKVEREDARRAVTLAGEMLRSVGGFPLQLADRQRSAVTA